MVALQYCLPRNIGFLECRLPWYYCCLKKTVCHKILVALKKLTWKSCCLLVALIWQILIMVAMIKPVVLQNWLPPYNSCIQTLAWVVFNNLRMWGIPMAHAPFEWTQSESKWSSLFKEHILCQSKLILEMERKLGYLIFVGLLIGEKEVFFGRKSGRYLAIVEDSIVSLKI